MRRRDEDLVGVHLAEGGYREDDHRPLTPAGMPVAAGVRQCSALRDHAAHIGAQVRVFIDADDPTTTLLQR
jgi:hypothetical protein